MLLRQLQRQPLRSVVATVAASASAAWRSTSTRQLHDSSKPPPSPLSPPTPPQPSTQPEDHNATTTATNQIPQPQPQPQPPNKTPSLFEKLFPDETNHFGDDPIPIETLASQLLDDFAFSPLGDDLPPTSPFSDQIIPLRAQSMLILSSASKHLTESDFLRLGARGAHVEGWVGGILRVVQARDPDTLAPLGHYFVLFDSAAAATSYRDAVQRLWELGKTYIPGAHHGKTASRRVAPLPDGLRTAPDGTDVAAALRGFTLVPPSQRLNLEISHALSPERLQALDVGGNAAFVDRLAARAGSSHLVLVSFSGGRVSVETLQQAIREDGLERGLPWRVTDLENGILPFGKSILKSHDRDTGNVELSSLQNEGGRALGWKDREDTPARAGEGKPAGQEVEGQGEEEKAKASEGEPDPTTTTTTPADDKRYRQYPRFIIPFTDDAEAHRFVRYWHRRELRLQMSLEGEKGEVSWDETRIFNTEVLW
ncbi:uncharacterized protein GGS25DRAFT_470670 [Hypoxylon fragiforme]|uniref:uncharacterized protein n=1 Tax=Hypoxylon fragiforme TaxID=63214 RepID=UPI0020C70A97|nr:uncharacterized protein GGS25DRAFT_470670 [Hypoxylon fragiforme]KAI2614189.1 hypothetical protein GGS25DRAFT_470670 [Hypoxylon fragiforme]